jgi:hypothetical protein
LRAELAAARLGGRRFRRQGTNAAQLLVNATIEGIVESLEPSRAVAVTGTRLQREIAETRRDINQLRSGVEAALGPTAHEERLRHLPPTACAGGATLGVLSLLTTGNPKPRAIDTVADDLVTYQLRMFGLPDEEAREIAHRPLPKP